MSHKFVNCFMSAVLLLTAMLLFPPYPAMAADSTTTQFNVPDAQPAHISDEIVLHFTNTASLKDADGNQTDPNITSICRPITADDVGIEAQRCSSMYLFHVRRLCDQTVVSNSDDCTVQYSHHDESAMYWLVENTRNVSECVVHISDSTLTLVKVTLTLKPAAEYEDCTTSVVPITTTEKLPGWVMPAIVGVAVFFIIIIVIVLLCLCVRCLMWVCHRESHRDKENTADTTANQAAFIPVQAKPFCVVNGGADVNRRPYYPDECISVSMGMPLASPPQATANLQTPPLPVHEQGHPPP